jgi:hypothetical protein
LNIGDEPHGKDNAAPDVVKPPVKAEGAKKAAEDSSPPLSGKNNGKPASNNDPSSPDYRGPADQVRGADWDEMFKNVEKDLAALKISGGGKKNDEQDFFVLGTIDIEDHKAIVDYPIRLGLKKAAELIADFMTDKPKGALRQWRPIGRVTENPDALARKARSQSIENQLEAFKPSKAAKRSLDDYFVVGTAELVIKTENADIRFFVVNGTKATASFLLDFILTGGDDTKRRWHVFYRARSKDDADKYIAQLRQWYDTMEAQRDHMAAIYHAKTTKRCRGK